MKHQSVTSESPTEKLGLTREKATERLRKKFGFTSVNLAREAVNGSGPPFYSFRGIKGVRYPIGPLDEWALRRIGEPRPTFKAPEECRP